MFKKRNIDKSKIRNKKEDDEEPEVTHVVKSQKSKFLEEDASNGKSEISVTTVYESSKVIIPHQYAGDATAITQVDTATDRDARAAMERKMDSNKISTGKITGTLGPMRAPTFLRATSRFDYQPDICKDYKETGFCGYGDNCKFLHDRGDYKAGWQLEKEWELSQKEKKRKLQEQAANNTVKGQDIRLKLERTQNYDKRKNRLMNDDGEIIETDDMIDEDDYEIEDSEFPFACHICREPFIDPIMTLCGHYFCEKCAIERNRNDKTCAICDKQTFGVFNKARKLIKHIETIRNKAKSKNNDNSTNDDNDDEEDGNNDDNNGGSSYERVQKPKLQKTQHRSVGKWDVVED